MWKKKIIIFLGVVVGIIALAKNSVAQTPDSTSYPDVIESSPPTVSIRSLNTGEPIRNGHYGEREDKNRHWTLQDIQINGKHFVQFRAFGTEQCLIITGATKPCQETVLTSFILVPTETGAFILQSPVDGACLYSDHFRQYGFTQCLRPSQLKQPIGLRFLWAIVPPFGQSKLLKVPTH